MDALLSYPNGNWGFNPLTWQLLFVFGAWCLLSLRLVSISGGHAVRSLCRFSAALKFPVEIVLRLGVLFDLLVIYSKCQIMGGDDDGRSPDSRLFGGPRQNDPLATRGHGPFDVDPCGSRSCGRDG
jgi:hypothetical protein